MRPALGLRCLRSCALAAAFWLSSLEPARAQGFARNLAERALERGRRQEREGDIALSLGSYDEAVRADPSFGPALLALADLRERLGDRDDAELLYDRAANSPGSRPAALEARALLRRAAHRPREATHDLAEAVELEPTLPRLERLGTWYVEVRAFPAALAVYRALLSLAEARQQRALAQDARVTVRALGALVAEADPVRAGDASPSWVRRSLSRIGRGAARVVEAQGARKLAP